MNIIDKLYTEWAWRTESGIPDIKNSKDKAILDSILSELNIEEEPLVFEGSESYDKIIYDRFAQSKFIKDGDPMPIPKGKYKAPTSGTFYREIDGNDSEAWKLLWDLSPPAKSTGTASKGVGNGEVALYWLYNYADNGIQVTEGREGDSADLFFGKVGVEVKAEGNHTKQIGLGRFGEDKENLTLLSLVFGLQALSKVLQPKGEDSSKVINPTNFLGKELEPAFDGFIKFAALDNLDSLASQYAIFQTIKNNVEYVSKKINLTGGSTAAAASMAKLLVATKLSRKPGFGGYLVNLKPNGSMGWFNITEERLQDSENLLNNFTITQSKIKLNYSKIFPK